MSQTFWLSSFSVSLLIAIATLMGASSVEARYTGTGPACVSSVNQLAIHQRKSRQSGIVGYLGRGQCGMNIESVDGAWTYIRGSDGGRNVEGWVRNRFLRSRNQRSSPDPGNEENNVASASSCESLGRLRTSSSNIAINVRIVNGTSSSRTVFWIDQNGRPKQYKMLSAGESYVQKTFVGHPWMFTDGPGNCKEIFIPTPDTRRYVISFDR